MDKWQEIRKQQKELGALFMTNKIDPNTFLQGKLRLNAAMQEEEDAINRTNEPRNYLKILTIWFSPLPDVIYRIQRRFPHLTFDELIEFERTMRDAGGTLMTHSGSFEPTKREIFRHDDAKLHFFKTQVSWTCCHTVSFHRNQDGMHTYNLVFPDSSQSVGEHRPLESPDLINRDPTSICDHPVSFSDFSPPIDEWVIKAKECVRRLRLRYEE